MKLYRKEKGKFIEIELLSTKEYAELTKQTETNLRQKRFKKKINEKYIEKKLSSTNRNLVLYVVDK